MKIKVEYSESIQVAEGLWRKIGIEIEDGDSPMTIINDEEKFAQQLHNQAKEYVQRWHKEANPYASPVATDYNTGEQVQITKEERITGSLELDIKSCKDLKILETYRLIVRNRPDLKEIYDEKLLELQNKQ